LQGGLELAPDSTVKIAEGVNTWGFPLIYNGPAPIISVGYVSGYYKASPPVDACDVPRTDRSFQVTHLVVNGAFNPGNSGAPLFLFGQNKVVGLVNLEKYCIPRQRQKRGEGFHQCENVA
jgi:S1-C subfamily serine protease